jgi:hypothetical protein
MATVFSTMFHDEALVLKSILESAEIDAEIAGEHLIEVYPIFFPEEGGIRVVVPDEQVEDALPIVADFKARKAAGLLSEEENDGIDEDS